VLYKEENVYGDRSIDDYEDKRTEQLLEAERVKKKIRDLNQICELLICFVK
jgi:hypothetical protein